MDYTAGAKALSEAYDSMYDEGYKTLPKNKAYELEGQKHKDLNKRYGPKKEEVAQFLYTNGYAMSEEAAALMAPHMSEEWLAEIHYGGIVKNPDASKEERESDQGPLSGREDNSPTDNRTASDRAKERAEAKKKDAAKRAPAIQREKEARARLDKDIAARKAKK